MYQKIKKITKTNKITIEQLYALGRQNMGSTPNGHESVDCPFGILNIGNDLQAYYGDVRRVIRHKVSKEKWAIEDCFGNVVFVTGDHSLMVMRNGVLVKSAPKEMCIDTDMIVSVAEGGITANAIVRCECVGAFDNEYVYDIEMNDDTHTFVANNILVHNSCYTSYDQVIATTDWCYGEGETNWRIKFRKPSDNPNEYRYRYFCGRKSEEYVKRIFGLDNKEKVAEYELERVRGEVKDFVLLINELKMEKYFKLCFDRYAESLQTENYLDFELETYSDAGIWLAKKKYVQNLRWSDKLSKIDSFPPFSKIKAKGIEMIQASAPAAARKLIKKIVIWMFEHPKFTIDDLRKQVMDAKKVFSNSDKDDVSWNKKPGGYGSYVLSDNNKIALAPKCPPTISACALYNYLLKSQYPHLMSKYPILTDGNKYKYFYIKPMFGIEMFAFESGLFPSEFKIFPDYDACFEHAVLDPLNRIITAMGFEKLEPGLKAIGKLF